MFLGYARGSVGDVTMYRANGQQVQRVRNRNPRNPKSKGQLYTRAVMATIVRAYSAGKEIFDHSFQGESVGSGNQRKFTSLNTKLLRSMVANDVDGQTVNVSRVVGPGVQSPVPNGYIISRGGYAQNLFKWISSDRGFQMLDPETQVTTVADFVSKVGLVPGDIYTFVAFANTTDVLYTTPGSLPNDKFSKQLGCVFGWIRCIVKTSAMSSTAEMSTISQIFDFESSGGVFDPDFNGWGDIRWGTSIGIAHMLGIASSQGGNDSGFTGTGSIGVIRSRVNEDLRSNSEMKMVYTWQGDAGFGLTADYLLPAWQAAAEGIGSSDLILEGGDV